MDTPEQNDRDDQDQWEPAVSTRLAKLRSMPVDTTRLERALGSQIPRPQMSRGAFPWRSLHPLRAAAASFLVVTALVAVLMLTTSSGPVLASTARMAKLHEEVVSGRVPVVQVDSISEANKVLSRQWPNSPEVPEVPKDHVMACCMTSVKDKKLACVLMKRDGVPVTLTVAHGRDMRVPDSPVTVRDGVHYHVQDSGKLNMVMAERQGRWVCLIGELPAERLMEIASKLRY